MIIMVSFWLVSWLLELVLCAYKGRRYNWWISVVIGLTIGSSLGLMVLAPSFWAGLLVLLSCYRAFSDARFVMGRMPEQYIRRSVFRSSWVLMSVQLTVVVVWIMDVVYSVPYLLLATVVSVVLSLVIATALYISYKRTRLSQASTAYADAELPSISVAIPARNETDDLEACLHTVLASNYPKMEVLVLDDCSQLRRAAAIIKGFAHDGVRFVQGSDVKDGWLAKNQAYDKLADQSSGKYLLFCGVDVRFGADSIRQLVSFAVASSSQMLAVVPERAAPSYSVIQPMRYFWELAVPRRYRTRPPVLSTCWLVERSLLESSGGFEAARRMIVPEVYFAKLAAERDEYQLLRSNQTLGIISRKSLAEQWATAVRTRYPQVHRRVENIALLSLLELLLLLPFGMVVAGILGHAGPGQLIASVCSVAILVGNYATFTRLLKLHPSWYSLLAFPLTILSDIVVLHYSMYRYEFATVTWKDRNICIPVMQIIPRLPKA